jgi:pterin-4a-carbinolamine dehydratase
VLRRVLDSQPRMTRVDFKMTNSSPLAFISYRRMDSAANVLAIRELLQRVFGGTSIFVDVETIRTAQNWRKAIDDALREARLLILVIGPTWLRSNDEFGQRRLDKGDDWVRNEIKHALEAQIPIIPLLVNGAELPPEHGLPEMIRPLASFQRYELRSEHWEHDLRGLVTVLERYGFRRFGTNISYPPPTIFPNALRHADLEAALQKMPGWTIEVSDIPGQEPLKRAELTKLFQFKSFVDAIDFMHTASRHINQVNHHPRWENMFRNVLVYLTTWNIGHKPSTIDFELASYFDGLFKKYQ